jgi:hypothetical protein
MKIKFKREYLVILSAFAAKDDVRGYLNGFHVKPHPDKRGVILTATDGHRLVTIYDEYGLADDQYILPITKELLAASKKTKTKDKRPLTEIQIIDDRACVLYAEDDVIDWFNEEEPGETDRVYHVEYIANIGGFYPNTKRIFEAIEYKETSTVCVNPNYIGDLVKICVNARMPYINLMFCGASKSIIAIGGLEKEIAAIIMPAKGEEDPVELPEFVNFGGGEGKEEESENKDSLNLEQDFLYEQAAEFVKETRKASISSIQRKFKIGYNRATNLIEILESTGVVSSRGHNGLREVLI